MDLWTRDEVSHPPVHTAGGSSAFAYRARGRIDGSTRARRAERAEGGLFTFHGGAYVFFFAFNALFLGVQAAQSALLRRRLQYPERCC